MRASARRCDRRGAGARALGAGIAPGRGGRTGRGSALMRPPHALGGAQAHRVRAGVLRLLGVARQLGAADEEPELGPVLGQLDRQAGGRGRAATRACERALDDAVLERLVGQHDDPAADRERVERGGDGALEHRQLLVDLDAQRLEHALGRVARRAAPRPGVAAVMIVDELGRIARSAPSARARTIALRVARRELLLAVLVEDAAQLGLAVLGEDVARRCSSLVASMRMSSGASFE